MSKNHAKLILYSIIFQQSLSCSQSSSFSMIQHTTIQPSNLSPLEINLEDPLKHLISLQDQLKNELLVIQNITQAKYIELKIAELREIVDQSYQNYQQASAQLQIALAPTYQPVDLSKKTLTELEKALQNLDFLCKAVHLEKIKPLISVKIKTLIAYKFYQILLTTSSQKKDEIERSWYPKIKKPK